MKPKKGKIRVKTEARNGLSDFLNSEHTVIKNIGRDQIIIDNENELMNFFFTNITIRLSQKDPCDSFNILRMLRDHGAINLTDANNNRIRVGVVKNVSGNGVPAIRITVDKTKTECALLTKKMMDIVFSKWADEMSEDRFYGDMWESMQEDCFRDQT